ncbi:glycosyl transferase family protein [Agaribacter flavus]|uniref:Glycosyl transferase family protein n=1 Tax=Agaribacter flavus TaxID=1902781 RepID=A0ABV7FPV6_9ALTE
MIKDYIKKIGRGKGAGQYLSLEEAETAMNHILSGEASEAQTSAFLMLLRYREESVEEIAGFIKACRKHNPSLQHLATSIDLDLPVYAGKRRHIPWLLLAVFVLAQNGRKIFLHGTQEPDSKRLYIEDVLSQFGYKVASHTQQIDEQLNTLGFSYANLHTLNPNLDKLIQMRAFLGLRSCANTLARMINPLQAPVSLQGVYHKGLDIRHSRVATLLNDPRIAVFRGEGGENECNPERPFALISTKGQQSTSIDCPALLEQWTIKPKLMDVQQLKHFWCEDNAGGALNSEYAHAAVTGTLAIMLVALDELNFKEAKTLADALWSKRSKVWPLHN